MMQDPAASNWTQVFSQLPAEGLIVAGLGIGVGLILLAFGSRVLKPAFITAGLGLGATVGLVLAYAVNVPFPAWVAGLGGAAGFAILAFVAYKPAMGLCMAVLFGTACPLAVAAYAETKGHHIISSDDGSASEQAQDDIATSIQGAFDSLREADNLQSELQRWRDDMAARARLMLETPSEVEPPAEVGEVDSVERPDWLEKFDAVIAQVRAEVAVRWNALDAGVRRSIVLSAASGAIFGLLLGLVLTTLSAAFVTSMGGSALSLASTWSLLTSLGLGDEAWMPSTATTWLILWVVFAALGLAIQWTLRRKPADTTG